LFVRLKSFDACYLEADLQALQNFRSSGSLFNLAGVFGFIPFSSVLLLARTRRALPSTWLFSFLLFYLARLLLQGAGRYQLRHWRRDQPQAQQQR
jgi:hypothetical protein